MWNRLKRCPCLCCVFVLFLILSIVGICKGERLTKDEALQYFVSPLWVRAFDNTLTDFTLQTNTSIEQDDITTIPTPIFSTELPYSPSPTPTIIPTASAVVNENTRKKGVTHFETYSPQKIHSPYYSDVGMIASTTDYDYKKVGDSYFEDAAFIGDSRMLGIYDYTTLKKHADFFCESGFSLFRWTRGDKVLWKNQNKKVDLETIMKNNHYKKVYITIGMNDLGYGNEKNHGAWMKQLVDMIQKNQENVIIYLIGNLHMSKGRNNPNTEFNNINVNARNVETAKLADGEHIFYLNINPLFTDKNGYLKDDISSDGCHVYGYCYEKWEKFLKNHAVVPEPVED